MATTTTQASGTTSPDDWTLAAGATKAAAVNQPDDDATTYLRSTTSNNTVQTFTLTPALSSGDTITAITLTARMSRTSQNTDFVIGYAFTPSGGGTQTGESTTQTSTATWTDFTYTHSSLSVLWGSGLTLYIKNVQAREARISTFYATITYTPGSGGSTQPPRTMHQMRMRIQG
ncbi:MAG: hypothetical protein KA170_01715 [Candidatus Promineofilum sp.]|nr:hypothetical protein [Promineifilum sp.]